MGEFFKPWRRKAGIVMLVLACVFVAELMRSPLNKDSVQFECGTSFVTLASNENGLWWVTSELPGSVYQPVTLRGKSEVFALPGHRHSFSNDPFGHLTHWFWVTEQRWDWHGFHYGRYCDERPIGGIHLKFRIMPHWAAILPLTLLSAFLLLFKHRKSIQQTITERIPVEKA